MSSGSTITSGEDFVLGKKLLVHVAENGHSLEFECDGSTPVEAIQRSIETLCDVRIADQLLLCRNTTLDSEQQLSYYKLPQDDREVFLYNKPRLHADSPSPVPEAIDVPEPVLPPPPSPAQDLHPLDNSSDPALAALVSYERKFRYHFQLANAFYSCTQAKFEVCKRLLREQQVQERALETARGNLEHTYRKLQQRCTDFIRCYSQQHRRHADLLAFFERDVDRLRALKLHPALQSDNMKCLLDLVKQDDLRKWFSICLNSHRQFEAKVSQLKANFGELKRRVDNLFSAINSASCRDLEHMIREHHKIINDQKSIMQSLSKDVNTAKKLVDDSNSQLSMSLRPHDAVSALGRIYDVHEKDHLPNVQSCDHTISRLLGKSKSKKNSMNLLVHVSMQKVKSIQLSIKDMMNELHAFQEVMGHQEKEFENVKFVKGLGHAYRACLAEIVRRKSSLKLYMGLAGQLAERLATERADEIRKREEFLKAWNKYIRSDILASMGLFDSPSQCDVNIAPFDRNLLEIDVVDLDHYAPLSLLGLPSKSERSVVSKSGMTTSSNTDVTKSEEHSVHNCETMELQDLIGSPESVDITGTSKLEVENARLKSELASAITMICTFHAEIGYDSLDEGMIDNVLKTIKDKTTEALQLKDEYAKHLESMLNVKQDQCRSYEKRIQELEQRLSDNYLEGQKITSNKYTSDSSHSVTKDGSYKLDLFGHGESQMPFISTMPMDEASSMSALLDPKLDQTSGHYSKPAEGGDENMCDILGNMQSVDSTPNLMDASMLDPTRDENQDGPRNGDVNLMVAPGPTAANNTSNASTSDPLDMLPCVNAVKPIIDSKADNNIMLDLQNALAEKSNQLTDVENKLKTTMEEVTSLRIELEISRNLLDESQMNCAHLENCLHEAREEAHTNLCAADRRASEYNALRTSAIKLRSLFERFRSCVTAPGGIASFIDSLRSLSLSLSSSSSEDEDDGTKEFHACIKVLSDKVGLLSRHRVELFERCSRAEVAHGNLLRELEEKKELIKSLYAKRQANKERISFGRFEVHELAAFVMNSFGHYEAINRNCSNYYLSEESIALFMEQHSNRPAYIIGQIVHIERKTVKTLTSSASEHGDQSELSNSEINIHHLPSSGEVSNPYRLPIGCEYFIVTIAMLPDNIHLNTS